MFLFVVYAFAVWWCAAVYRRQWPGFLAVALGLAGLLFVNHLHTRLNDWMNGAIMLPVLRHIMYPYTALVVGGGLYAVLLPRREPEGSCAHCGYSLKGLPQDEVDYCPECGGELMGLQRSVRRPRASEARTFLTYRRDAKARQAAGRSAPRPPEDRPPGSSDTGPDAPK